MAEALVGGAFLSGFVNVVFDRLLSPEVANLIRGKKLHKQLVERLKTALGAVQVVLNDAELKQINDPAVKNWLHDLRDAVYVADDLLDTVFTESAARKEVSNFFSRFLNLSDRKVASKIEDITSKLEYIVSYKDTLGLRDIPNEDFSWRTPSTCLLAPSFDVYGRDQDKDNIKQLLLDDSCEDNFSVIPIWGMGGVGKTTLAQWLYNDESLMGKFDLKAWVCVSEESSIVNITKSVIAAVNSTVCDVKDLNLLQLDLKERLAGKKFFVVLDDVWNIDHHGWKSLKGPFQYGTRGSKIIVTTRSEKIASTVQTIPLYSLRELSEECCWSLFAKHARFPESGGDSELEKIGRDIVKRCRGLPLAVETLGGLLHTKHDFKNWKAVLTSEIWEIPVEDSKIIPALKVSYYHLPPHLKRCFGYCSLFPKDCRFYKDDLIEQLWMAEDLLRRPKKGETLEEVASECFDDLVSRSFFKKQTTDYGVYFVMHDLMHDLAISVAGDFYIRLEELEKADNIKIQTRHLSYGRLSHKIRNNLDAIDKVKSLRTFLPIPYRTPSFSYKNVTMKVLSKLEYVRVLSFHDYQELDVLPDLIGELIHLRYLDLSRTGIKRLPESLNNLYNLQTLKLYQCYRLTMLPKGMQNLVNLRHLDIRGTELKEMPHGMSKLKHLQVLSDFVVGKHEENGIRELRELSSIHGSLRLGNLENVTDSDEAEEARIKDNIHIEDLTLEWSFHSHEVTTSLHMEREILCKLHPHKGLKSLSILRYRGTRFSDWVGHSSYHSITHVNLESCTNCETLPSFGQLPHLKSLMIAKLNAVERVGDEFYKNENDVSSPETPFPSLETLTFNDMSCWKVWCSSESYGFPQLKNLEITACPVLKGDLPRHFPDLETLVIDKCGQLVCSPPRAPALQELRIEDSNGVGWQEFPISVQSLTIGGCELVESMVRGMTNTQPTCLGSLKISGCWCGLSFAGDCLPECLKILEIKDCKNIELPNEHKSLESLEMKDSCDLLTSLSLEAFPKLKSLWIQGCKSVQSLLVSASQTKVSALHFLRIDRCPNFECFPTEGLAAPNLTSFYVEKCPMLKSLPSHMNTLLPKLEILSMRDCPNIDGLPEGGIPPNLKTLSINKWENVLTSMGVHQGLTYLGIEGVSSENVNSFPREGLVPQLPSLERLRLVGLESVETLDCNGLLHLTSLQSLEICNCRKLKKMVGERLPPSLIKLQIYTCPLLGEEAKKKRSQIWHKISRIPGIQVDGRWVSADRIINRFISKEDSS